MRTRGIHRTTKAVALSCALVCACLAPWRARAEDPPKELLEGIKQYGRARFNRSLKALNKAARTARDPQILARIFLYVGCNYIELKEESAAREALRKALTHAPSLRLDPAAFKDRVRQRLEQIKRHLFGVVSFTSGLPDVKVYINGKLQGVAPLKELAVPAGLHWLEVKQQGKSCLRRRWSVSPGQEDSFTVSPTAGTGQPGKALVRRRLIKEGRACSRDGWCWENPLPRGSAHFSGVWGSGPGDVFFVGSSNSVLHFDGQTWLSMPLPPGSTWRWDGIWGTGPTNVHAVGAWGSVARYDGHKWTKAVPRRSITDSHLRGVWGSGPSNVFAVGNNGAILHHDGAKWRDRTVGWHKDLAAVWGANRTQVFAAGGILLQYDGVQWNRMKRPPKAYGRFRDIWGTGPTNIFLTGLSNTAASAITTARSGAPWHTPSNPTLCPS